MLCPELITIFLFSKPRFDSQVDEFVDYTALMKAPVEFVFVIACNDVECMTLIDLLTVKTQEIRDKNSSKTR